jgi:hypothetical protein
MKLAVTDANIFIDLIKLQMLGYLFKIDFEVHTTREIIDQLNTAQYENVSAFVQAQLLSVYDFSSDELNTIVEMDAPRALEIPDKTVVYLATKLNACVLTGDGPLRKFCAKCHLEVKGILWLFDAFLERDLINYQIAIDRMNFLLSFNDRLPKDECLSRIKFWQEKK